MKTRIHHRQDETGNPSPRGRDRESITARAGPGYWRIVPSPVLTAFSLLSSVFCLLMFASCASRPDLVWTDDDRQRGLASWYDEDGMRTANGEFFNRCAMTAAHPSLALNSVVEVVNLRNGRSIKVRINDRLPADHERVIDLSKAAFQKLDLLNTGIIEVELHVIRYGNNRYVKLDRAAPAGRMYLVKPRLISNSSINANSSAGEKTGRAL